MMAPVLLGGVSLHAGRRGRQEAVRHRGGPGARGGQAGGGRHPDQGWTNPPLVKRGLVKTTWDQPRRAQARKMAAATPSREPETGNSLIGVAGGVLIHPRTSDVVILFNTVSGNPDPFPRTVFHPEGFF